DMPALWCVHMLVPLIDTRPPPFLADVTPTPGAATMALVFENGATSSVLPTWPSAATDTRTSDPAGGAAPTRTGGVASRPPALPAAPTISDGCPTGPIAVTSDDSRSNSVTF